jgi:cobalt-zinc-cadmium efflux system outer membrane protein
MERASRWRLCSLSFGQRWREWSGHAARRMGSASCLPVLWLLLGGLTTSAATTAQAQAAQSAHIEDAEDASRAPFAAREDLRLTDLLSAVRVGAPALSASRRAVALAEADARQARLLGNPSLEAAWATVPVGRTNPSDLARPYANVPSYALGIAYTFPVHKRAPRRQRADALLVGSRAELEYQTRDRALELAEVLGGLATATLRREGISELLSDGERAAALAEARLRAQFGTGLDVDQLRIDVDRTEQLLRGADADILENLAACSSLVGRPCTSFPDAASARAFLTHWLLRSDAAQADLTERADLRALSAYGAAARADRELSDAQKLPDPTLRLGYVHDRFTIAGNQLNSLNLGVSVPLPTFDRGQAQRQSADAARRSLGIEREQRLQVARARIPVLRQRHALSMQRCQRLGGEIIPKARAVLTNLENAVESRLLPLTQVIQARRVVSELFIEEAGSCGDAYAAALELLREMPGEGAPK